MRWFLMVPLVWALAGAVRADPPPPWMGVWQGTLGGAEVRACFGTQGQTDHGAYYYLRHLKLIRLDPAFDNAGQAWSEGDADQTGDTPRWVLTRTSGGVLGGTWSDKSGRRLPVRLTRIPLLKGDDTEEPCRGMTFMGPRLAPPTVTRIPASLDGTRYVRLIENVGAHFDVKIEAFELPGSTPAIAWLNTLLAKPLPGGARRPDWLTCLLDTAGSIGEEGEFEDVLEPDVISAHWLVTSETQDASCGDRQRSDAVDWRVFSLPSGEAVDPWSWFTVEAVRRRQVGGVRLTEIQPRLRKILTAHWTGEDECKDVAETEDGWDIHPTRDGLAFWPRLTHLRYPCADDLVVPYAELTPLLNETGRASISSIVEEFRRLPPRPKAKL